MLCERGYDKEPPIGKKPEEHKDRLAILKLLLPEDDQFDTKIMADLNFVSNQTFYTPLHWLAYWNDSDSIVYCFKIVKEREMMSTPK